MRVLRISNIEEFMLIIALVCRVQLIKNVKMNKFQFEIKLYQSQITDYLQTRSKNFLFSIVFIMIIQAIKNLSRFFLNSFLIINGMVWPSQKKKWRLLSSS